MVFRAQLLTDAHNFHPNSVAQTLTASSSEVVLLEEPWALVLFPEQQGSRRDPLQHNGTV